jgi:hypothetical protein
MKPTIKDSLTVQNYLNADEYINTVNAERRKLGQPPLADWAQKAIRDVNHSEVIGPFDFAVPPEIHEAAQKVHDFMTQNYAGKFWSLGPVCSRAYEFEYRKGRAN